MKSSDDPQIGPFPWHRLPNVSPLEVQALGAARRFRARVPLNPLDVAAQCLEVMLGQPVSLKRRPLKVHTGPQAAAQVFGGWQGSVRWQAAPWATLSTTLPLALALVDLCFGRPMTPQRRQRPLSPLERGALSALAADTSAVCGDAFGQALSLGTDDEALTDLQSALGDFDAVVCLSVEARVGDTSGEIGCLVPLERWRAAIESSFPKHPQRPGELFAALSPHRLGATLLLGSLTLDAQSVGALEVGGLLLGGSMPRLPAQVGLEVSGRRLATGTLDLNGRLTLMETKTMSDDTAQGQEAVDAGALPIKATLELGQVELTLAQWSALAVGDVLPLEDLLQRPVTLRVGQRVLGRAELVSVGEALGLRITGLESE